MVLKQLKIISIIILVNSWNHNEFLWISWFLCSFKDYDYFIK